MLARCLIAILLVTWQASSALAHPHAWIDLRSRVLLDDEGKVRALQLDWFFDDYYTVALADEVALEGQISDETWTAIAQKNLQNLAEHHYFTRVKADGAVVATGEVTRYEGGLRDGRMWMRFDLPLVQPVDPKTKTVTFSVYDPTYYIEIVHLKGDVVTFDGREREHCVGEILQPNPTLDQVSLAAALDQNETAGDGLGELFAETVAIHC